MKKVIKTIQCAKGKFTNIGKIGKGKFYSIHCSELKIKYNNISHDIISNDCHHLDMIIPTNIYIKPKNDCEIIVHNEYELFSVMETFYKKWNKTYGKLIST